MDGFGDGFSDGPAAGFGTPGNDMGNEGIAADGGFGPSTADGGDSGFLSSMFNPAFDSQQASFDLGFNPADMGTMTSPATAYGLESDAFDDNSFFGKLSKNPITSFLLSLHPALAIGKLALDSRQDAGKAWGGKVGGTIGSFFGPAQGIIGAMAGSQMGTGAFNGMSGTAADASASPTGSGNDWGGLLAGLYSGYQGMKSNQSMLSGLQSLYSQDSPYSQALRQQLARRDAQGGRRSQYGPREVELQAKLAQMASNQIPAMSQMNNNQTLMRAAMLRSGLGFANKLGLGQGLQNLFSGSTPSMNLQPDFGGDYNLASNMNAPTNVWGDQTFDLGSIFGG